MRIALSTIFLLFGLTQNSFAEEYQTVAEFLNAGQPKQASLDLLLMQQLGITSAEFLTTKPNRSTAKTSKQKAQDDAFLKRIRKMKRENSFPSSGELNEMVSSGVNSPETSCESQIESQDLTDYVSAPGQTDNLAAIGAQKLLATFFQSCKALDTAIVPETPALKGVKKVRTGSKTIPYKRKLYNRGQYVDSHIILNMLDDDPEYPAEMCMDMTKKPPVYGYGSRKLPNKSGEVKLFTKGSGGLKSSKPASMIDCSSFISIALGSQGLKVNQNGKNFESLTTRNFESQVTQRGSCLKHARFKGENTIQPGDMINVAGSHIVMIDTVSEDPLAVKKFAELNKCNSISIADFDFTYIHSGAIKNSYGPSRVHISTHRGGTMFNNLRTAAVKQCRRIVANREGQINSDKLAPNGKFAVIRHMTNNNKCRTGKKIKLQNEECVEQCMDERTQGET